MTKSRLKKRFGQHLLIEAATIDKILHQIDPTPGQTILEIGPGQGALTIPMARTGATVYAVEFDRDMVDYLKRHLTVFDNATVIEQDILKFDPSLLPPGGFTIAGNLPYNITSPIIEWIVGHRNRVDRAVLMMQREVAERLAAGPGGKDWAPISIFTQLHFSISFEFKVSPSHFEPPPGVWSAVVALKPSEPPAINDYEAFEKLVRAAFAKRRKQLVNNLTAAFGIATDPCRDVLAECGLDVQVRAEQLPTAEFIKLTDRFTARNLI